jgi:secreted PhoX family phosphatase
MLDDDGISNPSNNRSFQDVLEASLKRRTVLQGSLAAAATTFFAAPALAKGKSDKDWKDDLEDRWKKGPRKDRKKKPLLDFEPVALADGNGPVPVVSADYDLQVLIPWGDPLEPGGPEWQERNIDPARQAEQIGIGHDGMWYFPLWRGEKGNETGMLAINHEFGSNEQVLGGAPTSLNDVRFSQTAHGVSVVRIRKTKRGWRTARSRHARRIHVNTPVTFSGPVAGSPLLENPANNEYLGTVNNCANGYTPWGTYLTCEENFNGYFGANGDFTPSEMQLRYGLSANGFGYQWHVYDARFDLNDPAYVNEANRFGWIVEIDPMDGRQVPVKRTALGRFKHEGIALTEGRGGRVVGYMGDDERFDYIYKFVSDGNWRAMRRRGLSPLDHGRLYVAKFEDDGSGTWLELTIDNPSLAAEFADQAEVLTYARRAADILGATPMDRPEWTSVAPTGEVYVTLTNNSRRAVADAANPLAPNPDGHIIRFKDSKGHTGTHFSWEIFLIAQDTHGTETSFADPDGLWADPDGRIFIQTDGGQKDGLNNQMLVADAKTKEIRRILTGPVGCEITGITVTPDRRTMFVNVQHPGEGDLAATSWPADLPPGQALPRDATLVLTRKDGGIIGS